jgi:hypothetical protein
MRFMKKYTLIIFLFAVTVPKEAHAGKLFEKVKNQIKTSSKKLSIGSKAKSILKTGLNFVPGGGIASSFLDQVSGGSESEKIDGIFDGVVEISDDVMQLKKMSENAYFQEMRSRRRGEELAEGIRKANVKKIFGAAGEEILGIPINPADYVPNLGESTSKLKQSLDLDMDHERKLVRENGFSLHGSRRALLRSKPDLWKTDPKRFKIELEEAEKFEDELGEALEAENMARLKILNGEITRLQAENKKLAENLNKKGIKPREVIQTQQAINNNTAKTIEHKKDVRSILEEMRELHEKDKLIMEKYRTMQDSTELSKILRTRRRQIKEDYKHLSLLKF